VRELGLEDRERFEQFMLPRVDAAFDLARWLLRERSDAEDVTQAALLRAIRSFWSFHGSDARAWLMKIVRKTCYTRLEKNRPLELGVEFEEKLHLQTCAFGYCQR